MLEVWEDTNTWYLPAESDLSLLFGIECATVTTVNASLNAAGAVAVSGFYYSSTEKSESMAALVSMSGGTSSGVVKFGANKVRAVAAF